MRQFLIILSLGAFPFFAAAQESSAPEPPAPPPPIEGIGRPPDCPPGIPFEGPNRHRNHPGKGPGMHRGPDGEGDRPNGPRPPKGPPLKLLDKNDDGALDAAELADADSLLPPPPPGTPSLKEIIEKFDTDKDGALSKEELTDLRKDFHERMKSRRDKILEKFDVNKDGILDETEKESAKTAMFEKWDNNRKEFLNRFDTDGDGKLSDEEKEAARKAARKNRGPGPKGPPPPDAPLVD